MLILIRQLGREKIHWVVQFFGNEVIERFLLASRKEHPNYFTHVLI